MKRWHLFEFEDLRYFPHFLRNYITDLLTHQIRRFNIYGPVTPKLLEAVKEQKAEGIVDLCSGGCGVISQVAEGIQREEKGELRLFVSDKFPNEDAFNQLDPKVITPIRDSVDARDVPKNIGGFRTLFTAFHHFRPQDAEKILSDAVEKGCGIGIFEITERNLMAFLTILIAPIAALAFTPFVRPFKWGRLFWTYIIPIVPLAYTWDGLISNLRTYHKEELEGMFHRICKDPAYTCEVGNIDSKFHIKLTYLIAYQRNDL